ncbi:flagellar basal body rod protein FlgB [Selenihalanaerobacter shriftii]|uniref:Flagellar basal body rod protein FlgB n=1 Tax=Selenihalanaerobacter shriftii TaxID=142842 RepID=A0A1T4MAC7_9FIRM|nr:flagellar basal body rod protein FlgB [Selenihalanaerobacter shriftii]SJZ64000.1 flagellar basal-body rod protein FlgB [Selenihalanaerobacter shriftii]
MAFLGDQTTSILSSALDGLSLRKQAISNNIANVDTPNYKRKDVNFESQLQQARYNYKRQSINLSRTDNEHFSINGKHQAFAPKIRSDNNTSMRNDKNNVDIDYEMTALAKNTLKYQSVTKLLSTKFKKVGNVINRIK